MGKQLGARSLQVVVVLVVVVVVKVLHSHLVQHEDGETAGVTRCDGDGVLKTMPTCASLTQARMECNHESQQWHTRDGGHGRR